MNVIHTDGIFTGLEVKQFVCFSPNISIPFWISGYNRKRGLELREVLDSIKDYVEKENDSNQ